MYKDIISYELAEGITEGQLLKIADQIVNDWMKKLPGFVKWGIHKNQEGSYVDIVHWNSKEDAKNAEKEMVNIPNAGDWFACYKEGTISSKSVKQIVIL